MIDEALEREEGVMKLFPVYRKASVDGIFFFFFLNE